MRRLLAFLVPLLLVGLAVVVTRPGPDEAVPAADGADSQARGGTIPDRYVVVLRDSVSDPDKVASEHGRRYGARVDHTYRHALKGYSATIPANRLDAVRSDPRVDYLSADREVHATAELPTGVDRIDGEITSTKAGDGSQSGSQSVATPIAVIDTGSGPHSELNRMGGTNCSSGSRYDDGNGHGTHVAGTAAAKDNGVGVVGLAPGAPIYSVRVLNNQGSGSTSSVICGIDWVTANASKIKVANMSLGGAGSDDGNCGSTNNDAEHKAICRSVASGITYAIAAGNDNTDLAKSVPSSYNEVLAVTAESDFNGKPGGGAAATCRADVDETPADFSNFATTGADEDHTIAAPGVCIKSTWKGGGYNTTSGTSMASPHAAGTAALCIAQGQCTGQPANVIAKLRGDAAANTTTDGSYGFTGDPLHSPTPGKYYGHLIRADGY